MQTLTYWEFINTITAKTLKTKLDSHKKPQKVLLIGNNRKINDVSIHKL